jgi:NADH-quinone oxidoreductase subunit L
MLSLVMATNVFQIYIFWELVGVSSFLLIGFYYEKPSAVAASKKAFIVTRFADLFFLLGILLLSFHAGTFDFISLTNPDNFGSFNLSGTTLFGLSIPALALILIFIGGAGKSAMFPLHIWLPDAMEGPSPVSALIHAATMVVAGVYLVARLFANYAFMAPEALALVGYVGAFTSLFAAVIAVTQIDFKRVLAFSTISQIGYMMAGLGVSHYGGEEGLGYMASMFHLFTHAMFKALLFLGAGAVIHAVHTNSIREMGGLRKYMKTTHITFLIATLAIAGFPGLSGFFSKDEIITAAHQNNPVVYYMLLLVAGLTAFYMFRLYFLVFWNAEPHYHHKPHDPGKAMLIPLVILGFLAVVAGYIPFGEYVSSDGRPLHTHLHLNVALISTLVSFTGIAIAWVLYKQPTDLPARLIAASGALYRWAYHKFYIDEIYLFITHNIIFAYISRPIAWFDRHIVDGTMNAIGWVTVTTSEKIKGLQSGQLQKYAFAFVSAVLVISALLIYYLINN